MQQDLVTACIPVIIPSLQTLIYLWQRQSEESHIKETGLLLAVSDFQGRHPPLPFVTRETDELMRIFGFDIQLLKDESVTVANLRQLSEENGFSRFAFLHIASHAFGDQLTGRLSGLALYDHDLWLDELNQFAPLPQLVTLSACSGIQSRIYEGDEHVGLAITCLVAGAESVVGSLWPVLDENAPDFALSFYHHFITGQGVAKSLAYAQRYAIKSGLDRANWGSFQCVGKP